MARPTPFWLSDPSRFADLGKKPARFALLLLLLLLLVSLTALFVPEPGAADPASTQARSEQSDLMLYEGIVAGLKGGGGYYEVAVRAMRGADYPLRPFLTVRMPALATIQAVMAPWGPPALLILLAAFTALAWALRLAEALPRLLPRIVAALLLAGSMLAFFQAELSAFHELWAGLLIALSLALRRPGRWIEAVAVSLAAMLIRETAALYPALMALLAWREGARREALAWGVALALFAVALGLHAYALAAVTGPGDAASPGWTGLLGFGFFVRALTTATVLQLLPLWVAGPLVALALFGWAGWRDPLGLRVFVTLASYAVVIALFARPDNFYWALVVAPVFLAGLAFAPDGLRDLFTRALDKRRITVTRVVR